MGTRMETGVRWGTDPSESGPKPTVVPGAHGPSWAHGYGAFRAHSSSQGRELASTASVAAAVNNAQADP